MSNFFRICRNSFYDALREPVYALMLATAVVLIYHYPAASLYVFYEQLKMVTDSALATILLFSFLVATLSAGAVLAREMRNGTVLLLLSKPVSKRGFLLGKMAGVILASELFALTLAIATLISLRIATDQFRFDIPVYLVSLALVALAAVVALAANYLQGAAFGQVFSLVLPVALAAELGVLAGVGEHFEFAVGETVKALALLLCSVPVAAALATALSTVLDVVPTLWVMAVLFILGMLSDYFFGRSDALWSEMLYAAIPAWQLYYLADALALNRSIPLTYLAQTALYSALYIVLVILWADFGFRDRESAGRIRN